MLVDILLLELETGKKAVTTWLISFSGFIWTYLLERWILYVWIWANSKWLVVLTFVGFNDVFFHADVVLLKEEFEEANQEAFDLQSSLKKKKKSMKTRNIVCPTWEVNFVVNSRKMPLFLWIIWQRWKMLQRWKRENLRFNCKGIGTYKMGINISTTNSISLFHI